MSTLSPLILPLCKVGGRITPLLGRQARFHWNQRQRPALTFLLEHNPYLWNRKALLAPWQGVGKGNCKGKRRCCLQGAVPSLHLASLILPCSRDLCVPLEYRKGKTHAPHLALNSVVESGAAGFLFWTWMKLLFYFIILFIFYFSLLLFSFFHYLFIF